LETIFYSIRYSILTKQLVLYYLLPTLKNVLREQNAKKTLNVNPVGKNITPVNAHSHIIKPLFAKSTTASAAKVSSTKENHQLEPSSTQKSAVKHLSSHAASHHNTAVTPSQHPRKITFGSSAKKDALNSATKFVIFIKYL
jgi:hypothetical protein